MWIAFEYHLTEPEVLFDKIYIDYSDIPLFLERRECVIPPSYLNKTELWVVYRVSPYDYDIRIWGLLDTREAAVLQCGLLNDRQPNYETDWQAEKVSVC